MSAAEIEAMEDKVLAWLSIQNPAKLEEVFDVISLDCPPEVQGKKKKLLKFLVDHLCSLESVPDGDEGYSTLLKIQDFIGEGGVCPVEIKKEKVYSVEDSVTVKGGSGTVVDVVKFKEFKISGTIAGKGDNQLSYTSLSYQIEEGRRQGYSEQMIAAAIVKAVSPSNNLRTYLERKKYLSLGPLIEILRSHFKEKDSSAIFTELSNAVQQLTESCLDFVIRLLCLREKVLSLSIEEGCPYDEERLRKTFFHTMFTGLRNVNIRSELREKCREPAKVGDELLMKYVSEAVANEGERNEKMISAKKNASVHFVETEKVNSDKEIGKRNPFVEIEQLKVSHQDEMAAIKTELFEIKSSLRNAVVENVTDKPARENLHFGNGNSRGGYFNTRPRNFNRRMRRCEQCVEKNI